MDADIQFGDLEEAQPDVRLRPDRNKHFVVAAYERPRENDLPIYVDLDVMRDMEAHARENTNVELGGVLLGGQFEDEDGEAFVVVSDSLRAQHYEATKGSFKFTHDTWEQISRERDDFPEDLQMVGWYHTHPDWGVFLSGMDMFICDNFFNRPLDLALVIDPCRGDRGMFMWTGNPSERIRRTGGFYVIASRFRQYELELFTCQLEGKLTMASDPRFAGQIGHAPAPVVNIAESRNSWQGMAVMGMLTMQFLVMALIAWKLIVAPSIKDADKEAKGVAKIEKQLNSLLAADDKAKAHREVLDGIVSQLEGGSGVVAKYEKVQEELRKAKIAADTGFDSIEKKNNVIDDLDKKLKMSDKELKNQVQRYERQIKELDKKKDEIKKQDAEIALLSEQIDKLTGKDKKDDESGSGALIWQDWRWISAAATIVVLLIVAGVIAAVAMRNEEENEEDYGELPEERPDRTNDNEE